MRLRWPPARPVRTATVLWCTFAFVVWHVVFDRILVLEGRAYVHAASVAASSGRPYVLADPWMRTARRRAVRLATAAGGAVLVTGLAAIALGRRRP